MSFAKQAQILTVHTNTLSTLLGIITRPGHRLLKASRRSLTPRSSSAETVKGYYIFSNPRSSSAETVKEQHMFGDPRSSSADTYCRRLVHGWQTPFELHSDSRSLVDIWKQL